MGKDIRVSGDKSGNGGKKGGGGEGGDKGGRQWRSTAGRVLSAVAGASFAACACSLTPVRADADANVLERCAERRRFSVVETRRYGVDGGVGEELFLSPGTKELAA
ncbi:hypothetical protein HPB48_024376 [Haemaphysalis longicornis]|uniref:Uncharacterized protein n=1 Tax=Haemaphysalis longicornis TaxID=44386 RepID=A0A9J6H6L1_HAELO|nr:hypothetical protein HPB48_024376 [Haemaphysalis longicornis]